MAITLRVEAIIGNKVILTAVETASSALETELIIKGIDFAGLVTAPTDRPVDQITSPGHTVDVSMVRETAPLSRVERAALAPPAPAIAPEEPVESAAPPKKGRK